MGVALHTVGVVNVSDSGGIRGVLAEVDYGLREEREGDIYWYVYREVHKRLV